MADAARLNAFTCEILQPAALLTRFLHTIAHEWSVPHQRKGKQLVFSAARDALCAFEGSPCPLLANQGNLLAALSSSLSRPLRIRRPAEKWASDASPPDVLILPVGAVNVPEVPAHGPAGRGCAHGTAEDGAPFDGAFTCSCANTLFFGANCEQDACEHAAAASRRR